MNKEEFKNLIIYTSVYYQNNDIYRTRSKIWFKTFNNAKELGVRVVVRNDGGLPEDMLEKIKLYSNIIIVNKTIPNTLGGGRREALQKAMEIARESNIDKPIFLWTEPEKDNLITRGNLLKIVSEIQRGSHIAVIERKEESWEQLPKFQSWIEKRANERARGIMEENTGRHKEILDLWFGPKAFDKIGAQYFLKYNLDGLRIDLWDAHIIPVFEAIKKGEKVSGVPVDFLYNEIQIQNESDATNREIKIKRLEQYAQILKELGDKKWVDFFEKSKDELEKIKDLEKEVSIDSSLLVKTKNEIVQKFFKIK